MSKCPRKAMQETRTFIKRYLKKGHSAFAHLGEAPSNLPDARRMLVAMQDEYCKSRQRHNRASDYVQKLQERVNTLVSLNAELRNQNSRDYCDRNRDNLRIMGIQNDLHQAKRNHAELKTEFAKLIMQRDQLIEERDAVLLTMKLQNQ